MGFEKVLKLKYGLDPDYFKIVGLNLNTEHETCKVTLFAWLNKAHKDSGGGVAPESKRVVMFRNEPLTGNDPETADRSYDKYVVPVIAQLIGTTYGIIKEKDAFFSDAKDV